MSEAPPRYSSLGDAPYTPVSTAGEGHAVIIPYAVGSICRLREKQRAYPSKVYIGNNYPGLDVSELRRQLEYDAGSEVEILGVTSRQMFETPEEENLDNPVNSEFALYAVFRIQRNIPCKFAQGPVFQIKIKFVKKTREDLQHVDSITQLTPGNRCYTFSDVKVNLPSGEERLLPKNTPIVVIDMTQTKVQLLSKGTSINAREISTGVADIRYLVERRLTHEELRPQFEYGRRS